MQTGEAGGAPSAAEDPDIDALLDDDLADIDELLASLAVEPPRTPAHSATAARQSAPRIHGDAPASPATNSLAAASTSARRAGGAESAVGSGCGPRHGTAAPNGTSQSLLANAPHWPVRSYSSWNSPPPPSYTTTLDPASPPAPPVFGGNTVSDCTGVKEQAKEVEPQQQRLPRLLDYSALTPPSENRLGGDELAGDPSPDDPRLGVVESEEEEVVLSLDSDLQELVEEHQRAWAVAVAFTDAQGSNYDHERRREQTIERERAEIAREALEMERAMRRVKAMTKSAKTGSPVTIYGGPTRITVKGPRWLAERPLSGTAAAARWEHRYNGLIGSVAADVRREMEEEEEMKAAANCNYTPSAEEEEDQHSSDSDRDTYINPDSSPALPLEPTTDAKCLWADFEEDVGDGSYQPDVDPLDGEGL